jgi:hypothetical protein
MSDCGAEALAAAFRSVGLDAAVLPPPDARTLELGALYLNGDECLPAKVTLGDLLKLIETPGFRPEKAAFFMPRRKAVSPGHTPADQIFALPATRLQVPTTDGYREAGAHALKLMRTA